MLQQVLTVNGELDLGLEGCLAHDAPGLAHHPGVVVGGRRRELVEVFRKPALGVPHALHLHVVAVPHELRGRISALGAAHQLDLLAAANGLALLVAFDARLSRGICEHKGTQYRGHFWASIHLHMTDSCTVVRSGYSFRSAS